MPSGEPVPVIGIGTWRMAENPARRDSEITSLRLALDIGMTLIDTAEMYAAGAAEQLVGEAIAGRRDEAFLVSKVLPSNASRTGTIKACERSLARLGTDQLDLYLLHWPGPYPLSDTIEAFTQLVAEGKIRYWGVSNFDVDEMPDNPQLATDQVLYNLTRRGIELNLLPWCQQRGIPIMAYSPIEQGRLLRNRGLAEIAREHNATPAQIALAWVLRHDGMLAIPKASRPEHVQENWDAQRVKLSDVDLSRLDELFPPPDRPVPLEML